MNKQKDEPIAESLQGIRQLNKSVNGFVIFAYASYIAYRQLYSPYAELWIYLISLCRKPKYHANGISLLATRLKI